MIEFHNHGCLSRTRFPLGNRVALIITLCVVDDPLPTLEPVGKILASSTMLLHMMEVIRQTGRKCRCPKRRHCEKQELNKRGQVSNDPFWRAVCGREIKISEKAREIFCSCDRFPGTLVTASYYSDGCPSFSDKLAELCTLLAETETPDDA